MEGSSSFDISASGASQNPVVLPSADPSRGSNEQRTLTMFDDSAVEIISVQSESRAFCDIHHLTFESIPTDFVLDRLDSALRSTGRDSLFEHGQIDTIRLTKGFTEHFLMDRVDLFEPSKMARWSDKTYFEVLSRFASPRRLIIETKGTTSRLKPWTKTADWANLSQLTNSWSKDSLKQIDTYGWRTILCPVVTRNWYVSMKDIQDIFSAEKSITGATVPAWTDPTGKVILELLDEMCHPPFPEPRDLEQGEVVSNQISFSDCSEEQLQRLSRIYAAYTEAHPRCSPEQASTGDSVTGEVYSFRIMCGWFTGGLSDVRVSGVENE